MSLETGTYVNDLVEANPPGTDDRSQADNHMRLIKGVLKNTFPGASKAFRFPTTALEAAGTVTVTFPSDQNKIFPVNAAAAVRTVSLPDPSSGGTVNEDGFGVVVFKTDSSGNVVNVTAAGAQTINGVTTLPLQKQWDFAYLWWSKDNAEWYAITSTSIGTFVLGSTLTPAALGGDQNDYAPTGHESAFMFRLEPTGAFRTITGLAGGVPGRVVALSNISTTLDVVLNHESVSSTAANRFVIDYIIESQIVIGPGESLLLYYDGNSSRWRPLHSADLYRPIFGTVFANEAFDGLIDAVVGNPAAGRLRLYAKTTEGVEVFAFKDTAGLETVLRSSTQAEMEAAATFHSFVSPAIQKYHPGHPKAWAKVTDPTTLEASYGVTSITKNGTGDYTVTFSTAFSSAHYAVSVTPIVASPSGSYAVVVKAQTTTTVRFAVLTGGGTAAAVDGFHVTALGDQ